MCDQLFPTPHRRRLWVVTVLVTVLGAALWACGAAASEPPPDVMVAGLTLTPGIARAGESVTVSVTIRNRGSGPAGASRVALFLGTPGRRSLTSAIPLVALDVDGLAPGASQQLSTSFAVPPVPPGSFSVIAVADGAGRLAENNEANNQSAAGLQVAMADLTVSRMALAPRQARIGDKVTATVFVRNVGPVLAHTSILRLYLETGSGAPVTPAIPLGEATIDALKAGESRQLSLSFAVPALAYGRSYRVRALADADGAVLETYEGNNLAGATLSVSVPDLTVSSLSVTPTPVRAGDPITVTLRVRNRGPVPADATVTSLYLTAAVNAPLDGTAPVATIEVPALAAGTEARWTRAVPLPVLLPGFYQLVAVTDSGGEVVEDRETNNQRSTGFEVAVPAVAVRALDVTPSLVQPGQSATASVRIANGGRVWSRPTTANVFLATSDSASLFESTGGQTLAIDSLRPGASVNLPVPLTVPLVDPGAYYVIAEVDASTGVGGWTTLVASAARSTAPLEQPRRAVKLRVGLPDLVVSQLTVASTEVRPGTIMTAVVTVRNGGSAVAASTLTALLFGACADTGGSTLKTVTVPSLAPGASASSTIAVPVPAVEPGPYCLAARADSTSAVTEAVEANNQTSRPVSIAGTAGNLVSVVDPTQLDMPWPKHSHYKQPWRAWLETVPATRLRTGVGINYNWDRDRASDAVELELLAQAGISRIRVEIGWTTIDYDTLDLTDAARAKLNSIVRGARAAGIRPLILLNAHHGGPGPHRPLTRTVRTSAAAGSRSLQLDSVAGIQVGYTGLSNLSDYKMAEALITSVNPATGRVTLSKPLPVSLTAGQTLQLDTLRYLPFYPPGTPQYEATAGGWLDYVRAVVRAVFATGLSSFDVEIWNELTFGSDFLGINAYYDPPLVPGLDYLDPGPGSAAWELGRRTVAMLASEFPSVTPIWGFSNTTFFNTPVDELPPGILGQSYHPYFFLDYRSHADEPYGMANNLEGYAPPAPPYRVLMPETAGTYLKTESLARLINPTARQARPSGSSSFGHFMTEFGLDPSEFGVTDPDEAQLLKAKVLLRAAFFWLSKGLDALWFFQDLGDLDPLHFDLVPPAVATLSRFPANPDSYMTPALLALRNAFALFKDARPIVTARNLTVEVAAADGAGGGLVFPGDATHPSLTYQDVLAVLPFQVDDRTFLLATYVMSRNILEPPPLTPFVVRITNVNGLAADIQYVDPLSGRSLAVEVLERTDTSITLSLAVGDSPYLLHIQE